MSERPPFEQFFAHRRFLPLAEFTPDGRRVLFVSNISGQFNLWSVDVDRLRQDLPEADPPRLGRRRPRGWRHAAEWLRAQDAVDGGRLGVYGGSYGGFATFSCVTRPPEYGRRPSTSSGRRTC